MPNRADREEKPLATNQDAARELRVGVFSMRMWRTLAPIREAFAGRFRFVNKALHRFAPVDAIGGWGLKPTIAGKAARGAAAKAGLPYIAFEDGFLRSLDLGVDGGQAYSVVADHSGVYYDATRPSDLENLLEQGGWETEALLRRARDGMALLRAQRLSKYNCQPELDDLLLPPGPKVLVIDQTEGDMSVQLGLADAASFTAMLEAARREHPTAHILVKTHPDVIAGKKRGYLTALTDPRITLIGQAVNPWSLFDRVEAVYTVTSQMGFEALIAGLPVRCFGMPFYAGWGASKDELSCPRRTRRRTVAELFAAAYLLYPVYGDPYTGRACGFEPVALALAAMKRQREENRTPAICLGFSRWKHGFAKRFLSAPGAQVVFAEDRDGALNQAVRMGARLVAWGEAADDDLRAECAKAGVRLLRMEDGFLRSVGLGVGFTPPCSLVLDEHGIYYDPGRPSGLERLLAETDFTPDLLARAARLRESLIRLGVTKYNVGKGEIIGDLPNDRRVILVPGQVEDDASIRHGTNLVRTNGALLRRVRADYPDAFLIYKPHPDVLTGLRQGALSGDDSGIADRIIARADMAALIGKVDSVATMTSLAGFEALLRGKSVTVYGQPFYAGWGLTDDRDPPSRRGRRLDIDALAAAVLILYPCYNDPLTGLACAPEAAVERLMLDAGRYLALLPHRERVKLAVRKARMCLRKMISLEKGHRI